MIQRAVRAVLACVGLLGFLFFLGFGVGSNETMPGYAPLYLDDV